MKMCKELEGAINTICEKYHLSEEVRNMITKLIQNNLDNRLADGDLSNFVEGLVTKLEN